MNDTHRRSIAHLGIRKSDQSVVSDAEGSLHHSLVRSCFSPSWRMESIAESDEHRQLSRAISNAFNAKKPVAAAHLLEFPLPGKKKAFGNQRFPLDNVGRYFGKPILATDPNFSISSGFLAENFRRWHLSTEKCQRRYKCFRYRFRLSARMEQLKDTLLRFRIRSFQRLRQQRCP